MKSYEDLLKDLYERRDNYLAAQKKKRKRMVKIAGAGSVFVAACVAGIFILHKNQPVVTKTIPTTESTEMISVADNKTENDFDKSTVTESNDGQKEEKLPINDIGNENTVTPTLTETEDPVIQEKEQTEDDKKQNEGTTPVVTRTPVSDEKTQPDNSSKKDEKVNEKEPDVTNPKVTDAPSESQKNDQIIISDFDGEDLPSKWNGKRVKWNLLQDVLEKAKDTDEIEITGRVTHPKLSYMYEGKTVQEIIDIRDNAGNSASTLYWFLEYANYLKSHPEEKTSNAIQEIKDGVGNEMYKKYTVNGEFLTDELKKDFDEVNKIYVDAEADYWKAFNAFRKETMEALCKIVVNYKEVQTEMDEPRIIIKIKKADFAALNYEDIQYWVFYKASYLSDFDTE